MIDIIICTYNEPALIKRCVNSILKQTIDEKFNILLVDGGSDKKTIQTIKELQKKDSRIKFLKNPAKLPEGEGRGKWLAFRKTRGEIFGIIDQDNELIGKDSLRKIIYPFQDKEVMGVACKLFLKKKDNLTNQCIALIGTDPFVAYRSLDGIHTRIKKEDCGDYETFEQKKSS